MPLYLKIGWDFQIGRVWQNAATTNVTPVYEDDKEMQLLLMLLMPMKMKHMDWTLPNIYLNVQTI